MRLLSSLLCLICLFSSAQANIITIDPDDFTAGQDISNLTPGVTLSTYANFYFGDTPADAIGAFTFTPVYASACISCSFGGAFDGQNVFGSSPNQPVYIDSNRATTPDAKFLSFLTFRADFLNPTNFVQVIGGAFPFGKAPNALWAFDSNDNLLAACLPGPLIPGLPLIPGCAVDLGLSGHVMPETADPWQLSIDTGAFNIAYVISGGVGGGSLVKSLTFASVPEPATLGLFAFGLIGIAIGRRRHS